MATVTSPILTDATFATKMDALAAAVKPDASDIPLTPPSGMTATNVQDGFSEIKQSLSQLHYGTMTKTFSNGYCEISTSDFGMSVKPTSLVMTPCNQIIVMRYDYDGSSSSTVKVYVGNNYSGLLRFCYWAF